MATQTQTIAQFDNGAVVVSIEYNDATNRITAIAATVGSGTLHAELTKPGGQTRSFTLTAGTTRSTNIPNGMDIGFDPESGEASTVRGTIETRFDWSPA
jgi:hypothetical protein